MLLHLAMASMSKELLGESNCYTHAGLLFDTKCEDNGDLCREVFWESTGMPCSTAIALAAAAEEHWLLQLPTLQQQKPATPMAQLRPITRSRPILCAGFASQTMTAE